MISYQLSGVGRQEAGVGRQEAGVGRQEAALFSPHPKPHFLTSQISLTLD